MARMMLVAAILGCGICRAADWKIESVDLQPKSEFTRHLRVTLSSESGAVPKTLEATVPITEVDDSFVQGEKLVVMGRATDPSAVVIFDLRVNVEIDWFYCIGPQRVDASRIAYVEFYPNHSSVDFNDVVLLYDLSRSPSANRVGDAIKLPTSKTDTPYQAGIPVFPKLNAEERSYDNVAKYASESVHVLTSAGYAWLSQRLVFMAFRGASFPTYVSFLTVVDAEREPASVSTFEIPIGSLLMDSGNNHFIRASKIVPDGSDSVRLLLPKAEYGIAELRVSIRDGSPIEDPAKASQEKSLQIPQGLKFIHVSEAVADANLLSQDPDLSQEAPGQRGTVRLETLIGKDGHVQNLRVVSGPQVLIPIAERAVRNRVYRKTVMDGESVAVVTMVAIEFGKQIAQ